MQTHTVSRAIISLWATLLVFSVLAASSPIPAPEPIDPGTASVLSSNLNLACTDGCPAASSAQQLEANAAMVRHGSAAKPVHLLGAVLIIGALLTAL